MEMQLLGRFFIACMDFLLSCFSLRGEVEGRTGESIPGVADGEVRALRISGCLWKRVVTALFATCIRSCVVHRLRSIADSLI